MGKQGQTVLSAVTVTPSCGSHGDESENPPYSHSRGPRCDATIPYACIHHPCPRLCPCRPHRDIFTQTGMNHPRATLGARGTERTGAALHPCHHPQRLPSGTPPPLPSAPSPASEEWGLNQTRALPHILPPPSPPGSPKHGALTRPHVIEPQPRSHSTAWGHAPLPQPAPGWRWVRGKEG